MPTKHMPRHIETKKPVKKAIVSRKEDPDQPEPEEEEELPAPDQPVPTEPEKPAEPAESVAKPQTDPVPIPPLFSGRQEDFPTWVRADMEFKEAYGHWMERNRKAG